MSILLASIQITIPRAHRRRLSSILKTPSRRCGSPGYFSYQERPSPLGTWGPDSHRRHPAENNAEETPSKETKTGRKCHDGASLQRNRSELSENAARGPLFRLPMTSNPILRPQNRRSQISSTPNSPFHPNNMPAMRPPCGISWQKRPNKTQRKVEWEVDNPFTRPQTARASFHPPDRNQSRPAHQIASGTSYVSAHPSPKHLDREAAPAQPAFRTPGISHIATRPQAARRRHTRQAASRIPNSMSTKPPMPLPPGLSHFPEKAAALFHVEGKTRERRRVRNASPAGKGARHGRANI